MRLVRLLLRCETGEQEIEAPAHWYPSVSVGDVLSLIGDDRDWEVVTVEHLDASGR